MPRIASIPVLPHATVMLEGRRPIEPIETRPTALSGRGSPPREILEAPFDAALVSEERHVAIVTYNGSVLARVLIDFGRLE